MAGIGFELRAMINERGGFVNKARAYLCAGLISSGPWLMTILTLTLLNMAGPMLGGQEGYALFRALVTYAFAFSLILQGIGQMAITRHIADLLYSKQYDRILPAFIAAIAVTGIVHAALGFAFCIWAGFDPGLSCLFSGLISIIGMTWISLVWLSVARQFDDVLRAYVYGTLVAMVGVLLLLVGKGTTGILAAYTAGQGFTLVLLIQTILRGMESGGKREFNVWTSVLSFPSLVAVGFFYNAAIWADKMIFWFRDGVGPHELVRYHPLYDTCSFLAYMTVVPALAINLVRLETAFYEKYRAYYGAILHGTPLNVIIDKRERMFRTLRESVIQLLRVQGAITIAFIVFAPPLIQFLELPPAAVKVFRLTCLGAFFHVMLLITVLMQLYFDLRLQAAATSFFFLVLNTGLAWWSVSRGVDSYGVGYAMASFLSLLLGYQLLHNNLEKLDYKTFTNQPISGDRPPTSEELAAAAAEDAADSDDEDEPILETPATPAVTKTQAAVAAVAQLTAPPAEAVAADGETDEDTLRFVLYPDAIGASGSIPVEPAPTETPAETPAEEPVDESPATIAEEPAPMPDGIVETATDIVPETATDVALRFPPVELADRPFDPDQTKTDILDAARSAEIADETAEFDDPDAVDENVETDTSASDDGEATEQGDAVPVTKTDVFKP